MQWKLVAMDAQAKVEELESALASEMMKRAQVSCALSVLPVGTTAFCNTMRSLSNGQAEDAQAEAAAQRDKLDRELRQIVGEIGGMREIFLSMGLQQQQPGAPPPMMR
jgi:predicted small secreted protein